MIEEMRTSKAFGTLGCEEYALFKIAIQFQEKGKVALCVFFVLGDEFDDADGSDRGVGGDRTGGGGDLYSRLSDGEIQDADAYSEISSDENFPDTQDIDIDEVEVPTPLLYAVMPFTPYNLEVTMPEVRKQHVLILLSLFNSKE